MSLENLSQKPRFILAKILCDMEHLPGTWDDLFVSGQVIYLTKADRLLDALHKEGCVLSYLERFGDSICR